MGPIGFSFRDECKIVVSFEHREPIFSVEVVYVHEKDSSYTFTLEGTPEVESVLKEGRRRSNVEVSNVWDAGQITGLYKMQRMVFYNHVGGGFHDEPMATMNDYEWPSFKLHELKYSAMVKDVRVLKNGEAFEEED